METYSKNLTDLVMNIQNASKLESPALEVVDYFDPAVENIANIWDDNDEYFAEHLERAIKELVARRSFLSHNYSQDNYDYYYNYNDSMMTPMSMAQVFGARFAPYTILAGCCCLFNILSLCAIMSISSRRTVHHTLLLNLACCDILGSGLLWMYYNAYYLFPQFQITSLRHCLFIIIALVAPFILSLCSSSLSLLILAANQCVAICDPLFSATKITRKTAKIFILIIWLISGVVAMIPAMLMLLKTQYEICSMYVQDMGIKSIEICSYALAALIIIIIGLYARIYQEILVFRNRNPQLRNSVHSRARNARGHEDTERNYKAFVTTLLLSGTLVIFWLPYLTFHFITVHLDVETLSNDVFKVKLYIIDFLPMLNYITDPIIYGIRMREIRTAYHRLFSRLLPCCIKEPIRRMYQGSISVRFTTVDATTV